MSSRTKKSKTRQGRRARGGDTASGRREWWENLPIRTRHLVAGMVLIVVALVFFAPVNFEGKRIAGSDTIQARAMAHSMIEYRDETGEPPLWSTNLFSGMPGYMILYPKAVVQLDSIMLWTGRQIWPTVHFLFLVVGVYVLVFSVTRNTLAALIAALGGGLTTYLPIILSVGHTTKFAAIAWVPWLLLAFHHVLRRPSWIGAGFIAILVAAELRAGHPQISYHAAWLISVWWIVECVGAIRSGNVRLFTKSTAFLVLGAVVGLLLVAQPYMGQFEYKRFSTRGGSGGSGGAATGLAWDYAMTWSQGRAELLTLLVARLYGGRSGLYWGDKPFTEGPHYVGGVVILLALVAIVGRRDRVVWGLATGAFVLTLLSLGKNAALINHPLFDYFPLFSAFRAPEMWLHMVELSLAILAGLGASYVAGREVDPARRRKVFISVGCVLGVTLLLSLFGSSAFTFERPHEKVQVAQQLANREGLSPANPAVQRTVNQYMSDVRQRRIDAFEADAVRTLIVLVIATVFIWLFFRSKVRASALLGVLALLVLVDLWGVGKRHLNEDRYVSGDINNQIPTYGFDRFILDKVEEAGGPGHFRALSFEGNPINTARPAFYYETSGGYHAAKLQIYQEFIENVLLDRATGLPTLVGLDLTGTRYLVAARQLEGTEAVYSDPTGLTVWERVGARSRNAFVGQYRVTASDAETYALLNDPNFDPSKEAVVSSDPGLEPAPIDSASTASVELTAYGPDEIIYEVETDRPRILVTSEVYYPAGWTALIDEGEVDILQTNYAFRGIAVPAGRHIVRLRFDPATHELSVRITAVVTILVYGGLILLFGFTWYRRRQT